MNGHGHPAFGVSLRSLTCTVTIARIEGLSKRTCQLTILGKMKTDGYMPRTIYKKNYPTIRRISLQIQGNKKAPCAARGLLIWKTDNPAMWIIVYLRIASLVHISAFFCRSASQSISNRVRWSASNCLRSCSFVFASTPLLSCRRSMI